MPVISVCQVPEDVTWHGANGTAVQLASNEISDEVLSRGGMCTYFVQQDPKKMFCWVLCGARPPKLKKLYLLIMAKEVFLSNNLKKRSDAHQCQTASD